MQGRVLFEEPGFSTMRNRKVKVLVAQSRLTLCDPMDRGLPGSSVYGISQARILGWLPYPPPRDLPDLGIKPASLVSLALAGGFFTTWEAPKAGVAAQLLSCVQLFVTPWTTAYQASLSFTISWSLLKLMSTGLVMLSNCLFLCLPLFLLPSIFPPSGYFSVSALHIRWPKYCSFSPRPSKECSGLTSFRIDWFDLLAVQGTCKSLLQHHNLKALVL